ncbi:hypothetical protein CCS01_09765 [Rhodopila globiformis]|uniref:VTT domain-containing protein n=2 Tax=Rhodopila globiformis TaxID=1071 RepID=A0A2S6NJ70_RHOGL|nr:hypothetical protein CCS01_09765 [Rhodopila globiformis]
MAAAAVAAQGQLNIVAVLAVAAAAGILGDNTGFWVGRRFGFRLLCRYGQHIHVGPRRIKFLQYLFLKYGRRIVFIGRFVMILRTWEAFLAGADWMPWRKFAIWNAAAVVVWACVWGLLAFGFGHASTSTMEWVASGISVVILALLIAGWIYWRRHEDEFEARADEALPGEVRARPGGRRELQTEAGQSADGDRPQAKDRRARAYRQPS